MIVLVAVTVAVMNFVTVPVEIIVAGCLLVVVTVRVTVNGQVLMRVGVAADIFVAPGAAEGDALMQLSTSSDLNR